MTPGQPGADAEYQLRVLEDAWDRARERWHDDVLLEFAEHHWGPLHQDAAAYLNALRHLAEVLAAADRATGGSPGSGEFS